MTKAQRKRQALDAIDRAARLLLSASHDYAWIECDHECQLVYAMGCEVRDLLARLTKKRTKKARK